MLFKKGKASWETYVQAYTFEKARYLNAIYNQLRPNSILLCWESPELNCHRHILADMLNGAFNLSIKEFLKQNNTLLDESFKI